MMRAMVLEYPEDRNCDYLARQYFLGDSLLVAPIFNDKSMAEYYLPEGTWTSLLTGKTRPGGRWYREHHGYLSIPLYVKENSILALGARDDDAVYDYADEATLRVYALQEGKTARTVVYSEENEAVLRAQVTRRGGHYDIRVEAEKPCRVTLMNTGIPTDASAPYEMDGAHVTFSLDCGGNITADFE